MSDDFQRRALFSKLMKLLLLKAKSDFGRLLARDAFVRTNRRAIAMMSVPPSVCLSGMGVHCDHTVHFKADLSLWLDSPMF